MDYSKATTNEERGRLREGGDKVKFFYFRFERKQVVGFWEGRGK